MTTATTSNVMSTKTSLGEADAGRAPIGGRKHSAVRRCAATNDDDDRACHPPSTLAATIGTSSSSAVIVCRRGRRAAEQSPVTRAIPPRPTSQALGGGTVPTSAAARGPARGSRYPTGFSVTICGRSGPSPRRRRRRLTPTRRALRSGRDRRSRSPAPAPRGSPAARRCASGSARIVNCCGVELDGRAADLDLVGRRVEPDVAGFQGPGRDQYRRVAAAWRSCTPMRATSTSIVDRLDDVVVGTDVEGGDDPARRRPSPDTTTIGDARPHVELAAELDAVDVGQPEVEQDDVVVAPRRPASRAARPSPTAVTSKPRAVERRARGPAGAAHRPRPPGWTAPRQCTAGRSAVHPQRRSRARSFTRR